MRLIDERELIRRISELPDLRTISTGTIGKIIKECRTIDAATVQHGKWIEKPYLFGITRYCSRCNTNYGMPHGVFKYCPNCGAKMEGGSSDETT